MTFTNRNIIVTYTDTDTIAIKKLNSFGQILTLFMYINMYVYISMYVHMFNIFFIYLLILL